MAPRLALTPPVPEILKAIPPTTCIISLYVSQDASVLYCAALKGQQTSQTVSAGKSKPTKQGRAEMVQLAHQLGQLMPCRDLYTHTVAEAVCSLLQHAVKSLTRLHPHFPACVASCSGTDTC